MTKKDEEKAEEAKAKVERRKPPVLRRPEGKTFAHRGLEKQKG